MTANTKTYGKISIPAGKNLDEWITELTSDYSAVYVTEKIRGAIIPDTLSADTAPMFSEIFSRLSHSPDLKTERVVLLSGLQNLPSSGSLFYPCHENVIFQRVLPAMDLLALLPDTPPFHEIGRDNEMFAEKFEAALPFIERLFPDAAVLPLLADGTKGSKISTALKKIDIRRNDLVICVTAMSQGLSRSEANNKDAAIMTSILAQADNISPADTINANVLNAMTCYSLSRRLVPHIFKNDHIGSAGSARLRVNGYMATGYLL